MEGIITEQHPTPAPSPAALIKSTTVSHRFKNPDCKQRFEKVLADHQKRNPGLTASDFIWKMFQYLEKNPYGDFR